MRLDIVLGGGGGWGSLQGDDVQDKFHSWGGVPPMRAGRRAAPGEGRGSSLAFVSLFVSSFDRSS